MLFTAREIANEYQYCPSIAMDIETTGLLPWYNKIAVISFAAPERETGVVQVKGGRIPAELKELFTENKERLWVTHNGTAFDLLFFRHKGIAIGQHYDTLVGEQVLATSARHDVSKSLSATMKRRLGKTFKLEIDHRTWQAPELSKEQLAYAAADVEHLHRLMQIQTRLAGERNLVEAMQNEQKLTLSIVEISNNGMALSLDELQLLREKLIANAEQASNRLDYIWPAFNVRSAQQVKLFFDKVFDIQLASTGKDVLMMLKDAIPEAGDVLTVRAAKKRTGFYDDEWAYKYVIDQRVRSRFWQVGTDTTRFSSSDPNLQQIPRDMRPMFGNEAGLKVVAADYSNLEVRIAADKSKDPALTLAVETGDFHNEMAKVVFNTNTPTTLQRQQSKAATFTWLFGGGVTGLINMGKTYGVKFNMSEAQAILLNMRRRFSGVKAWHNRIEGGVRTASVYTVTLPWGHRRQLIGAKKRSTTAINTTVQGTAAIGLKIAILKAKDKGLLKYIGGLIHDEMVATSVPEKIAEDYGHELKLAMEAGMSEVCELPTPVGVNISDYWYHD